MCLKIGCNIYKCVYLLFVVVFPILANQCSLQNGQCTYNIQLSHPSGECSSRVDNYSDQQNDNSQIKVHVLEQDLDVVKTNHEDRIRELEASVQKLLRDAVSGGVRIPGGEVGTYNYERPGPGAIRQAPNRTENTLLSRLSQEFSDIRRNLQDKTMQLFDMETKFNQTVETLREAQEDLFETGEELITAEHKAATLEREGYILKNQLKDKTSRLTVAIEKLNASETKRREMELQLYTLVRSEANLKEELGYYKYKLNKTEKTLLSLQRNHTALKLRHARTKQTLRKTEVELMDCYAAKTQTFCGFETRDICGFIQENETDDFDWTRARVQTPSGNTGPTGDHTCGVRTGGHFMFIEASAKRPGQSARLLSVRYRALQQQCVEFYYHMYGRTMGTLNVYTQTSSSEDTKSVWRTFGNQGDVWIMARLAIPEELARIGYRIVFEGTTGRGYQGDMAIDDVKVQDGPCPSDNRAVAIPIPVPNVVRSNDTEIEDESESARRLRRLKRIFRIRRRHGRIHRTSTPDPIGSSVTASP